MLASGKTMNAMVVGGSLTEVPAARILGTSCGIELSVGIIRRMPFTFTNLQCETALTLRNVRQHKEMI